MSTAIMEMVIYDPDGTKVKHVDVKDYSCHQPRRKTLGQNLPLLPLQAGVSFSNDAIEGTDNDQTYDSVSEGELYYNMKSRTLPPIPHKTTSRASPGSSPKSSICSSCGCTRNCVKEEKQLNKNRLLTCIAAVSILFSLVSCSFATVRFIFKTMPSWEPITFKEGIYEICVPCVQLTDNDGVNAGLKGQLTRKMENKKLVCCASTSEQMSALVQLIIKQKSVNVVTASAQTGLKFTPVSAHKYLQPLGSDDAEEPQFPDKHYRLKLRPSNDATGGEHARHVTATNNSLLIQFSGWYMVYSSIYFRPRTSKMCRQLRHQTWGHFISRNSPTKRSTSGTLLQSAHTCCDSCSDDHHTSYTAGVFLLEAGDDVYVEVSGSGLVLFDEEASYLGLAMLGSLSSSQSLR